MNLWINPLMMLDKNFDTGKKTNQRKIKISLVAVLFKKSQLSEIFFLRFPNAEKFCTN